MNDTIPAKAEKTYSLATVTQADFTATSGTGSLYITSNTKIAAIATIHYPNGSAAYSGVSRGDTTLWVPGVFRKQAGGSFTAPGALYSASIIQNLGTQTANISWQLIGIPGKASSPVINDTIAPKASYGINMITKATMDETKWNTAMNAIGTNWQGALKVTCTNGQQLAGIGMYFRGDMPDVAAYEAVRDSDATTNALSMPATYRKTAPGQTGQFSATLVQNLDNTDGTINVKFYGADGTLKGNAAGYSVALPAGSSVRLNLQAGLELPAQALTDLGGLFTGAMYITSTTGQRIIGNNIIIIPSVSQVMAYSGFPVQ
jgi:hypothetical protein